MRETPNSLVTAVADASVTGVNSAFKTVSATFNHQDANTAMSWTRETVEEVVKEAVARARAVLLDQRWHKEAVTGAVIGAGVAKSNTTDCPELGAVVGRA